MVSKSDKEFGPWLVEAFKGLSDGDKSVLIEGARNPGSVMMTSKGSDNDRYWASLSEIHWTEQAEVPEALRSFDVAAWTVTQLGAVSLPVLFKKAATD